jgi:gag-polyprotein putative aspartyl protease
MFCVSQNWRVLGSVNSTRKGNLLVSARKRQRETVSQLSIVQSDSDSDSDYLSVPTIKIETRIQNIPMIAEIDSGATTSLVSSNVVKKHNLETIPSHPVRVHQAMSTEGLLVKEKLVSKVNLPTKSWESQKPARFTIAPLQHSEAILGMPFLAAENILIDPVKADILLPGQQRKEDKFDKATIRRIFATPSICPKMTSPKRSIPPEFLEFLNLTSTSNVNISIPNGKADKQTNCPRFLSG